MILDRNYNAIYYFLSDPNILSVFDSHWNLFKFLMGNFDSFVI